MTGPVRDMIWKAGNEPRYERRLTRPAIYLLLATVVLLLGLNWPIMATGLKSITPIWLGVFRVAGAFLVILLISASTSNIKLPPRRDLPIIVSLAVFRLSLVFVLVFTALQLVPAGRASVVVWTTSLWTVPIAAVWLGEKMSGRRWTGLVIGIIGVVLIAEPWGSDWSEPGVAAGHVLLVLAAITLAATAVHIRAHRWTITPLQAIPWQLAGAGLILIVTALLVEGPPVFDGTPHLAGIVAYQGMLATGVAFWATIVILRNLAAVSANLTLMAVPVVGVVSSAIILGEEVTTALILGMGMILAGVALNLLSDSSEVAESPGPLAN